jgi:hypothetical protein
VLRLNKAASGDSSVINGYTNGLSRWQMLLGNSSPESGSNAGSDFYINNFSDTGAVIISPFFIIRATGAVNIYGTSTNDNAAAGYVGEVISSVRLSAAAIALTTGVVTNITSIVLTPGDWDVHGEVAITVGTGGATAMRFGTSPTSAAFATDSTIAAAKYNVNMNPALVAAAGSNYTAGLGTARASVPTGSPVTYYLLADCDFPSGTLLAFGNIWARRAR